MKKISIKDYPYEMYCVRCRVVLAFIDHRPASGDPIIAKGVIKIDGTFPTPGEVIHECPKGIPTTFMPRLRKENETLSECCNGRMIGGVQCEVCGSKGE